MSFVTNVPNSTLYFIPNVLDYGVGGGGKGRLATTKYSKTRILNHFVNVKKSFSKKLSRSLT